MLPPLSAWSEVARGAVLLRAMQAPLEPPLTESAPGGSTPRYRATRERGQSFTEQPRRAPDPQPGRATGCCQSTSSPLSEVLAEAWSRRYEQAEASLASGRGLPSRLLVCPVEPQLREASVSHERTYVGLDVHAWSMVGHGLDAVTGEVWQRRLTPDPGEILGCVSGLPGPVKVVYEAGPTGFGLARHLRGHHRVECLVAAPSKLQRPAGDRVKTDARDAAHLAWLLKLDEIVEVVVPSPTQEAARDLVRAREDVRGDLMRARHRLSKFLLRQGIVWIGGAAWTG